MKRPFCLAAAVSLLLLLLSPSLALPAAATCPSSISSSDAAVLTGVISFLASHGSPLPDGWKASNVSQACCWDHSVSCLNGTVTSLSLSSQNLTGPLPPLLSNFASLQTLDLSLNSFNGSIPSSWASLTSLTTLNLFTNSLSGSLEPLGYMKNLTYLDLSVNLFAEDLRSVPLGNLTQLTILNLFQNSFTGGYPTWLGSLTSLTTLFMSSIPTLPPSTLPTDISGWPPNIQHLDISNMNLVGSLPGVLADLSSLQDAKLSFNNLTGSLPKEFSNFSYVEGVALDISANNLSGEIPVELTKGLFYSLDLHDNSLSGNISTFLMNLCGSKGKDILSTIDLHRNQLTGEIPPRISNCTSLRNLYVSENQLSGEIPSELSSLENLANLALESNSFSGEIPAEFSLLTKFESLTFNNNNFTGALPLLNCSKSVPGLALRGYNNRIAGPLPSFDDCPLYTFEMANNLLNGNLEALVDMPTLVNLSISGNQFNGILPAIKNLTLLKTLDISLNNFSGEIPATLGTNAESLTSINMSKNSFSGAFPENLFLVEELLSIDLSFNSLSTPLTSLFQIGPSLTNLDIRGNSISGQLPESSFLNAINMLQLNLAGNQFSGPLPSNFSDMTRIIELRFENNAFNGSIPQTLANTESLITLNFSGNEFSGSIPNLQSQSLGVIDFSSNKLSGELPLLDGFSFLSYLDLSSNELSGTIPGNYSALASLQYLDLSQNSLGGSIPAELGSLSNLTFFNVSGNSLSGAIPANLSRFGPSSYSNTELCGDFLSSPCAPSPPPPSSNSGSGSDSGLSTGAIVGIAVGASLAVLLLAMLLIWLFFFKPKEDDLTDIEKAKSMEGLNEGSFTTSSEGRFLVFQKLDYGLTVEEIVMATENFSDNCLLGRGGFGSVYRATLPNEQVFAVKRLTQGSSQGDNEFRAEMETLGKIRHKNLVTLVASYNDPTSKECLLIYNFLPGGNLDSLLKKGVEWPTRLNVAIGVARGLKYLHHDCIPYIIHRDMKPGNILMDGQMEAHVADFGLAKVVDMTKTHVSTKLLGTIGYLAPEYAGKGQASTKSDVFAYGVVLLQLVSGKLPTQPQMRHGMSQWAKSTPASEVIDVNLNPEGDERKEILAVLKLGIACTSRNPLDRPTMEEVLHTLENLDEFAAGVKDE